MRAVIISDFYHKWIFIVCGFTVFLVTVYKFFGGIGSMFMEVRNINAELLTIPGSLAGWGGEAPRLKKSRKENAKK